MEAEFWWTCDRVSTSGFGFCTECREDSWAARIHFHVHTGAEEACPYCLNRSEIFPSLWFTRRALWRASDFILQRICWGSDLTVDSWPQCFLSLLAEVTEALPWTKAGDATSSVWVMAGGCSAVSKRPPMQTATWGRMSLQKGRQVYRRTHSRAEPGKAAARMMLTRRQDTFQTDIPLHLTFPSELYLNEISQCKSVKANSRRTEEYFNRDTNHWLPLRCDTLPLRWYYSYQWDWYVSIC